MRYSILIICLLCCVFSTWSQGQVSRPAKNQTQTARPKKAAPQIKKAAPQIKISEPDGYINGHGYVDLGLPSGVKWATCNVGATTPGDYGNYYAWGELTPKDSYEWSNCFDCVDSKGYRFDIYKLRGGKSEITPTSGHDTARENWGGTWRMPTVSELKELLDKCKWEWTKKDGHSGFLVIGPNGNNIFLPAAGYRDGTGFNYEGVSGCYWLPSLSRSMLDFNIALDLHFYNGSARNVGTGSRSYGQSVRPVTE